MPTQDRGCISLDAADASMSPADLGLSIRACAKEDRAEDGAELFILFLARGHFDSLRVADETAHQAISVLGMEIANGLTPAQTDLLNTAIAKVLQDPTGPEVKVI